jgi:hypothetical protein
MLLAGLLFGKVTAALPVNAQGIYHDMRTASDSA